MNFLVTLILMADLHFYKYQGCGNDFIVIDNRAKKLNKLTTEGISRLCNRKFGIGADGLMFLQTHPEADFEMIYYNADGCLGSMCGNGGRCIVAFAKHLGLIKTKTTFLAADGIHEASLNLEGNWVSLKMQNVELIEKDGDDYRLNTGSPHYVRQVKDLEQLDVRREGSRIRNNETYRNEGINVNFIAPEGDGYFVRTFERGVEDETLACGTGVTAVALAMASHQNQQGEISTPIRTPGGKLNVRFQSSGQTFNSIYLEGPALYVFEGTIEFS